MPIQEAGDEVLIDKRERGDLAPIMGPIRSTVVRAGDRVVGCTQSVLMPVPGLTGEETIAYQRFTRVDPDFRKEGVFTALTLAAMGGGSGVPTVGVLGLMAVENAAIHSVAEDVLDGRTQTAARFVVARSADVDQPSPRRATPADAARIAQLLNAAHPEALHPEATPASLRSQDQGADTRSRVCRIPSAPREGQPSRFPSSEGRQHHDQWQGGGWRQAISDQGCETCNRASVE